MSDKIAKNADEVLARWGDRVQRYRLNRNLTQSALAKEAGVSSRTIMRMEDGKSVQAKTLIQVLGVLGLSESLEQLVPEVPVSPLVLAKREGARRKHAYPKRKVEKEDSEWSWGDDK